LARGTRAVSKDILIISVAPAALFRDPGSRPGGDQNDRPRASRRIADTAAPLWRAARATLRKTAFRGLPEHLRSRENRAMEIIIIGAVIAAVALAAVIAFGRGRNRCAVRPRIER